MGGLRKRRVIREDVALFLGFIVGLVKRRRLVRLRSQYPAHGAMVRRLRPTRFVPVAKYRNEIRMGDPPAPVFLHVVNIKRSPDPRSRTVGTGSPGRQPVAARG